MAELTPPAKNMQTIYKKPPTERGDRSAEVWGDAPFLHGWKKGGFPMKRIYSILFVLLLLCCSSCTVQEEETYGFETDCQYNYGTGASGRYYLAESEDGYYYRNKAFLHYIDKETMTDTVLCNKPNCLHDKTEDADMQVLRNCNAYVGNSFWEDIFYYKDAIYTVLPYAEVDENTLIRSFVLTQISLDGTKRKSVWDVTYKIDGKVDTPMVSAFHRGKLYFIVSGWNYGNPTYLFCYDMKTKKVEEIYQSEWSFDRIRIIEDSIYVYQWEDEGSSLVRIDLETKESKVYENGASALPIDGKIFLYFLQGTTATDPGENFYRVMQEDGTLEEYSLDAGPMFKWIQTDGTHLFITETARALDNAVKVYDYATKEKIATLPIPEDMLGDYEMVCTRDGKLMVFSAMGYDFDDYRFYYGNIADIATDNFQWHQVEKVN